MVGPDGETTMPYRPGALYEDVIAAAKDYENRDNGLVIQDGEGVLPPNDDAEDGNLEGPSRGKRRNDWEHEKERIKERQRLKEEAGGTSGPVPSYILEHG